MSVIGFHVQASPLTIAKQIQFPPDFCRRGSDMIQTNLFLPKRNVLHSSPKQCRIAEAQGDSRKVMF